MVWMLKYSCRLQSMDALVCGIFAHTYLGAKFQRCQPLDALVYSSPGCIQRHETRCPSCRACGIYDLELRTLSFGHWISRIRMYIECVYITYLLCLFFASDKTLYLDACLYPTRASGKLFEYSTTYSDTDASPFWFRSYST